MTFGNKLQVCRIKPPINETQFIAASSRRGGVPLSQRYVFMHIRVDGGVESVACVCNVCQGVLPRTSKRTSTTDRMARVVSAIEKIGGRVSRNSAGSVIAVDLRATHVTDGELKPLKDLPDLRVLSAESTRINGAGLAHLQRLARLKTLYLSQTEMSDDAMRYLEPMTQLTHLQLSRTKVTDAGMRHLRRLDNFAVVRSLNTRITDSGIEQLRGLTKSLPLVGRHLGH